jgi:predicted lipoprotein with Yx(FWY)xxD motif
MRTRVAIAVAIVAMLGLAASAGATQSAGTLVTLHKTSLGKVLATSSGRTLYLYTPDPKNHGTCTGSCASTWPPLKTKGAPRAGMGVNKMLLGQTSTHQVTYNHHPLYTYSADSAPGDTQGEGSSGVWFAVTAAGKKK